MTVKIEDIRKGDEVLVQGTVSDVLGQTLAVRLRTIYGPCTITPLDDTIAQHIPRKIEVGDKVRKRSRDAVWEVAAAPREGDGGRVEVALWRVDYGFHVASVDDLERVS